MLNVSGANQEGEFIGIAEAGPDRMRALELGWFQLIPTEIPNGGSPAAIQQLQCAARGKPS